jgi:hypothetical protein
MAKFQIARVPAEDHRLRRTVDQIVAAINLSVTTKASSVTQAGNTAATETDLFSYTAPVGTLSDVGDSLDFIACGTFAATAAVNKVVKVLFGATTIYNSGNLAITTAKHWSLHGSVTKVSATSQKCVVTISTSDSALVSSVTYTAATEDLASAVILRVRGNGTNTNDVVGQFWKVLHSPG